ncbi:L-ribulose-5-phosphate 3-epimerase [Serratia sp. DD3]|uniref:L-ribulose-5-phosphate 3-epimerase n=1 Tax=Serratia sp. DD3 TaxID=1410619 RepID=UPI0003C50873|nr:L-ribulose-5-phosphate 3-epimerase [Serratia sp. DD3]KEY56917.1 L-ribulose-5-phosphate 3-epimerase UlaE [Serratia sp. DD3]
MTAKIGIYEKALPDDLSWAERFDQAANLGFNFVEMSVDEKPQRQARLHWSRSERLEFVAAKINSGMDVPSLCLSAHRAYPFGSINPETREKARSLMLDALAFASQVGIRNIQLAGYDVYYEPSSPQTRELFIEGIHWAVAEAAKAQIMLSVEIMDTVFMSNISRWLDLESKIRSPWFCVYPDVGNLSAWNNDVAAELSKGIDKISAIHLKDTQQVSPFSLGQFRDVPFGEGCVDFDQVFRTLHTLNYRGAWLIEMWAKNDGTDFNRIKQAKAWLENKYHRAFLN